MKDDKRLKRKVRNSYIVATASISLVLFLLGSVGYLLSAAMKMASTLQQSVTVTVELDSRITTERREAIGKQLLAQEAAADVLFVSKEEKAEDAAFRELFGSAFEEVLEENPLRDSYEVTLTAQSADREAVERFIAEVRKFRGVTRVGYPAGMAERMHATVAKIRLVLLLFGGALLVISLILLSNTIRLAIYSKRYQINTMKLVGATRWFIMRPFLGSSITQGLLAGIAATALFAGAVYGLTEAVPEFRSIARLRDAALIAGGMVALGVGISLLFTAVALNRFINMKSNKIYLY